MVFPAHLGVRLVKGRKTRRKKLVSGITKHLWAQHDFFGADTRLGVYRALARSPRHYVKLNKHKSLSERASGERNVAHIDYNRLAVENSRKQIDPFVT